ncbi:MAG: ester cyclase [Chloroflexi bacterium]|nr:ester cyclase [Chloroflexota bacterium]
MSVESNKATMRSFFGEVISQGKVDLLDQIATVGFQYHDGDHHVTSAAEMKELVDGYRNALNHLRATVVEVFGEDDKVATRVVFTGTHNGDLMGVAPTGRPVNFTLTMVSQFAGDQISEVWINWDALTVLRQIGGYEGAG